MLLFLAFKRIAGQVRFWQIELSYNLSGLPIPGRSRFQSPLIEKRQGRQVWKPENFPLDDLRHGWSWEDCWRDALALLGSDQAVRQDIECEARRPISAIESESNSELLVDSPKAKQHRIF
jgi:hypothetical protein